MSKSVHIRVDKEFANMLKDGYNNMTFILKPTRKKITFTDYTNFLSKFFKENRDMNYFNKISIMPIKKGRRSRYVRLFSEF